MVLCLSELHFIFQKVHFLLEDCTRDDCRLWMLVKSEKVSNHFRELVRAIAACLDVLPLSGLDIAVEVEELVELVRKQALKANFEVEKDDRRAVRRVLRIIDNFEIGISPESSDLIRVLEYLGIKTWNECNNEIKLLESLTGQNCETTEKIRDFHFLSSLTAFMIYCRCTVFPNVGNGRNIVLQKHDFEMMRFLNPNDLRCPISLEIMTDPVTISTGHTYDRSSIQKWFKSGNRTCPKTGERLISVDLVPNHALKRIIKQYCQENGTPFPESGGRNRNFTMSSSLSGGAGSVAAEQAMAILANFLVGRLETGKPEEQNKSAYEIRLLTKTSIFNRSCLVEAHVIPPLLNLLCFSNPGAQENAMAALLNLSKLSESKKIVVENGGLDKIVDILNVGVKMETRHHAAGVLFYLSSVEEYRKTIGRIPGAITGLMGLIQAGPGKKNALVTILGLLMYPENHWMFLSAGLVLTLVNLLTTFDDQREEVVTESLAVLATLAEKLDGAMAIISAGGLSIIIKILRSFNSKAAKEYCVCLLLALCTNDGADVLPVLVKNTSLMASLYSILAVGSCRSSKKASSLIGILQAFNEKRPMNSGFPQEQFVHVW
ncbi:hypothetical protein DH2020_049748 [Rehmannia glutinosa]|uniref:RING-type E3 ubiquitin transferase n=1 Tax=Rehmannia glutinosa TaxID=99300 RepID=A0ABR0U202_REHGL